MDVEHTPSNGHRVDINNATGQAMIDLDGIGPVLAQRIIEYRETIGPFQTIEQLVDVKGIGASLLGRLADHLMVTGAESEPTASAATETPVAEPDSPEQTEARMIEEPVREMADEEPENMDEAVESVEEMVEEAVAEAVEEPVAEVEEAVAEIEEAVAEAEFEEPEDSPEEIAVAAADELEVEVAAEAEQEMPAMAEMGLYTRVSAEDDLSEWSPPPTAELDEAEEAEIEEPDEPEFLFDEDDDEVDVEPVAEVQAEEMVIIEEPVAEAFEPKPAPVAEPVAVSESAAVAAAAPVAEPAPAPQKEGVGFWKSLLMVLLGGLLGVLLTLGIAVIMSGTLNFASRDQLDALSSNVGTMQANQELAWQRIDELSITSQQLAAQVAELEQLRGTVAQMEGSLAQAEADLAATQASVEDLGADVDQLRTSMDEAIGELDGRVGANTEAVATLDASVSALEESFSAVEEQVGLFDGFFSNLRDLLIDMQGAPEGEAEPAVETATE